MTEFTASTASRRPSPKKGQASVGSIACPFSRRIIYFESLTEAWLIKVLSVRNDVVAVREQVQVRYAGGRRYTFDIVVTYDDGATVAYAIKPYAKVDDRLRALIETIATEIEDDIADEYGILTERDFSKAELERAEFIFDCARDFDDEAITLVSKFLETAPRQLCLGDIAEGSALGVRGLRAAVTLFTTGGLAPLDPGAFDRRTRVENTLCINPQ